MNNVVLYTGNFNVFDMNAAGKRVLYNCKALLDNGFEVLTLGLPPKKQQRESLSFGEIDNYYYPIHLFENRYKSVGFYKFFEDFLDKQDRRIDCIVLYGSPSVSFLNKRIIRYAKKHGMKIFADVVDWLPNKTGSFLFRTVKMFDNWYLKRILYKKVEGVIAISSWLYEFYKKMNVKSIIVPPLNETIIQDNSTDEDDRDDCTRIVYAGVPFPLNKRITKNDQLKDRIDLIIDFLSMSSRNFKLDLFGFDKEQLLFSIPRLEENIIRMKDKVVFHGKRDMHEIERYYKRADFSILFRDKNQTSTAGFPSKVSESLAFCVPVITNDTSDIFRYLQNDIEAYCVDLSKPKEALERIDYILSQSEQDLKKKKLLIKNKGTLSYINYSKKLGEFVR